jgi:phosphate transport system permease protein
VGTTIRTASHPDRQPANRRPSRSSGLDVYFGDIVFKFLCRSAALGVILIALLILAVLCERSWLAIRTIGWSFLSTTTWDPEPSHRQFGALAFVWGTVATSILAMAIAIPFGVATAAFLSELAPPRLRKFGAFLVEMLAAIPSVVYGFWGVVVLAPAVQKVFTALGGPNHGGVGIISASIVLAIMIVPYIAAVSFDVCRSVPRSQREAAFALGASKWQVIWTAVIPYARPGIIGGCFIALGRALGETMAVAMLIGNSPTINFSLFATGDSIASVIANQFNEATYDLYLSALTELGLVLLLVSVLVNSIARTLLRRVKSKRRMAGRWENKLVSRLSGPIHLDSGGMVSRIMPIVLGCCFGLTVVPLFLILGYLLYRGAGSLSWQFFVNLPAPVGETGGGFANALVGSAKLIGYATALSVPVGLLAAIYLVEFRSKKNRLGPAVRFVGELLGGVPSIVIGIFVYASVVKPMGDFSGWAGSLALGIMMVPIVLRASEEALKLVPDQIRHASYALGGCQYQTILRIAVPAAFPAIVTAVFLAIARVAGETAPLLLTAFSNQFMAKSHSDCTPSLPVFIYNYAISPYEDWHRQAWAAALVLLSAIMILNFGVRAIAGKRIVLASSAE